MAHVLLPCDLPFWPDVQQHLSQVKSCKDEGLLVQLMTQIHCVCCVSLDPEEDKQPQPKLFQELGGFLKDGLSDEERCRFLSKTLPDIAILASRLSQLRPSSGFLYSLRHEERAFHLERELVASLLANAFFSTFPRRSAKTHPTLQDFSFAQFFPHLHKRSHQKRLKAFFRYFEKLEDRRGFIHFTRKMVKGPSLPGWLCSDRPLLPVTVRADDVHQPQTVLQTCSSESLIGGDVLKTSMSKESRLLFTHPELLIILSFVESLSDSEVLVVEGIDQHPLESCGLNFCFSDFTTSSSRQFEDQYLLRELNKSLAAFERETPLQNKIPHLRNNSKDSSFGERRHSKEGSSVEKLMYLESSSGENSLSRELSFGERSTSKRSSFSERNHSKESSCGDRSLARNSMDEKSSGTSKDLPPREWILLKSNSADDIPKQIRFENDRRKKSKESSCYKRLTATRSTSHSSGRSMKTAPLNQKEDEHYFTADDDSEDGGGEDIASSRSESVGFVLGEHERLEDFRKRIRKRTRRRLSRRRSSSSSYLSSSSDMEDISEENPEEIRYMRVATSEPSLIAALAEEESLHLCQAAETLLMRGKKMMVTSSNGRLKAYSYDGVSPNLPVPFKAKFRRRRLQDSSTESMAERRVIVFPCDEKINQLKVVILWLAASMAEAEFCVVPLPGETHLQEISKVYSKVISRGWTIGDLSCEVLRFCRNSLFTGSIADLFSQLLGSDILRQPSLD